MSISLIDFLPLIFDFIYRIRVRRNMKRIVAVIALIYVIAAAAASGQDILVNPQNQKYLFTAGTDETQAFLYNPACLGLYSRGGVLDGYYFYPTKSILNYPSTVFHDIGIFGQAGKFGLAYRNAENSGSTVFGIPGPLEENLNQYSVGLGFGNQGIAVGASLSLTDITGVGSRWLPAIGLIVRPDRYISLGAAYHNFSDAPFGGHAIEKTALFVLPRHHFTCCGNENFGVTSTGTSETVSSAAFKSTGITSYLANHFSTRARSPVASISSNNFESAAISLAVRS